MTHPAPPTPTSAARDAAVAREEAARANLRAAGIQARLAIDEMDGSLGDIARKNRLPASALSKLNPRKGDGAWELGRDRSRPDDGDGTNFQQCSRVAADVWSKTLVDVYRLRTGSTLCVRTDQDNLAALVLTHVPSAGEQYLAFDFVTWATG